MTTGSSILNDIFIVWIPIVFALLIGVLGAIRGVRREAVVSMSVVLGALILMVWASSWATDLNSLVTGMTVADWQATLGYVVMGLVVLGAGYGLTSALVPRGAPTAASRLGGFFLGLANGAAIAGWIMRNHYIALRDSGASGSTETMNMLFNTEASKYLIIWSGWFPLVVAAVAAIIAIVGPARRIRPTTLDEWTPAAPPTPAPPPALGVAPVGGPGVPASPATTARPVYGGTAEGSTLVLPETQRVPYGARPAEPDISSRARADAPPTMPMPGSEGRPLYSGGQETLNLGLTGSPSAAETPSATVQARPSSSTTSTTSTSTPPRASDQTTQPHATPSGPDEPSWLAAPLSTGRTDPALERSSAARDSLIARSEAPTAEPVQREQDESMITCPRCGSREFASAAFCTQCGNRLKAP
jgi:hypothetical protein